MSKWPDCWNSGTDVKHEDVVDPFTAFTMASVTHSLKTASSNNITDSFNLNTHQYNNTCAYYVNDTTAHILLYCGEGEKR